MHDANQIAPDTTNPPGRAATKCPQEKTWQAYCLHHCSRYRRCDHRRNSVCRHFDLDAFIPSKMGIFVLKNEIKIHKQLAFGPMVCRHMVWHRSNHHRRQRYGP